MQHIGAFEAKTHLSQLLDQVEAGQEVIITRRGKPVARLVPMQAETAAERRQAAFARIDELRERLRAEGQTWTTEEILALRDEGRRF